MHEVAVYALRYLGTPYVGGEFDCSRFIQAVFRELTEPAEDFEGIVTYGGRAMWAEYYRRRREAKEKGENQ